MSKDIYFNGATVHFTYAFLPFTEHGPLTRESFTDFISCSVEGTKCNSGLGKPASRIGLSVYVDLDLEMAYLCLPTITANLYKINLSIDITVRLFPSASTCTFSVKSVNESGKEMKLRPSDVHSILHLVSQKKNVATGKKLTNLQIADISAAKSEAFLQNFEIDQRETTLFDIYVLITDKLLKHYNEKIESKGYSKAECEKRKITLLEQKHIIKEESRHESFEYQCPWVVSVLEVSGDVHRAFCTNFSGEEDHPDEDNPFKAKQQAIRAYENAIAPILYRSVTPEDLQLEPAYADVHVDGNPMLLYNMNLDSRLFVQTSRRSVLCICKDQAVDPAAYFIPSLIDLCEMIHTRSHTLIIFNKILDDSLKNFSGAGMSHSERLDRIISVITRFVSCLEDPSSFVISGDALREIHENLNDTSRISSLRDNLLKKIDMLERLYKYKLQTTWTRRT